MALNNKSTLTAQAQAIRGATSEGFNTAERVGRLLEELISAVDASLSSETTDRTTQDQALQQLISAASGLATTANTNATNAQNNVNDLKAIVGKVQKSEINNTYATKGKLLLVYDGSAFYGALIPLYSSSGVFQSQILITDGTFDGTGPNVAKILFRSYQSTGSSNPGWDSGTWTPWREIAGDGIIESINNLSTADGIAREANDRSRTNETAISQLRSDHSTDVATLRSETAAAEGRINAKIGEPNGIAPLDSNGHVPAANLPSFVDDVLEFGGIFENIVIQNVGTSKKSTDAGCKVVYDLTNQQFVLAVRKLSITDDEWREIFEGSLNSNVTPSPTPHALPSFSGIKVRPTIGGDGVVDKVTFDAFKVFDFYNSWSDADLYMSGSTPLRGKVYIDTTNEKTYRYNGTTLVAVGSSLEIGEDEGTAFDGARGKALENGLETAEEDISLLNKEIEKLALLPFNGMVYTPAEAVSHRVGEIYLSVSLKQFIEFTEHGYTDKYDYNRHDRLGNCLGPRTDALYKNGSKLYKWNEEEEYLEEFASKAEIPKALGNSYNVTAAREANGDVLDPGLYDNKQSAITYAIAHAQLGLGVQITFASGQKTWQTYQYVGIAATPDAFAILDNWIDLAGQTAGDEAVVNINHICRGLGGADIYTLETAIAALTRVKQQTLVNYIKQGMVITYKVSETEWESRQLTGGASDYTIAKAWSAFGGGASTNVETSNVPEADGEDAFSTGGAYAEMLSDFIAEPSADGTKMIYQGVSRSKKSIGNPIEVPIGGGGGGSSTANVMRIAFEHDPLYAAFGQEISTGLAARSYSQDEEGNIRAYHITLIEIYDSAGMLLHSEELMAEESSSSMTDYKFTLNLTPYFTEAGRKTFTIEVTDQQHTKRRLDLSVTAVDVNADCPGSLNESIVRVGAQSATLDNFMRFAKNASTDGIEPTVEIMIDGVWQQIDAPVIKTKFSQPLAINPVELGLTHGSYLMKIQGYDPKAKVRGNIMYTTLMAIEDGNPAPLAAIRYDDRSNGTVKLYSNIEIESAAVCQVSPTGRCTLTLTANGQPMQSIEAYGTQSYKTQYQIQGKQDGDIISLQAGAAYQESATSTPAIALRVAGSAVNVVVKGNPAIDFDFSMRSNAEADHTIVSNGVTMDVNGANWSSNGFGTCPGISGNALRVAENVTASIPYAPFALSGIESNGMAIQIAFATNNIKDAEAMLLNCYNPGVGAGFYIKGNAVGIYCSTGEKMREERRFPSGEKITMAVAVEPGGNALEGLGNNGIWSFIKLYLNGEEVAAIGYQPGGSPSRVAQSNTIEMNGSDGDLYIYYLTAWESYYGWEQAFHNYLARLTDTEAMVDEFKREDVLESGKPTMRQLAAAGIPYCVVKASQAVFDDFDGGTDTGTDFACDLYYFNPERPWQNFKANNVRWRRQGTTSAQRPIKNDRFYLNKKGNSEGAHPTITLLNPDNTTPQGREAIALAAKGYLKVTQEAIPVQITTIKVDYSDSSGANDCGVCDMMNATYRALPEQYRTPAQRAYDGSFTVDDLRVEGMQMDHSTKNHPIAVFRATLDTLADATFHAKGNWKEDKGEQVALGFMNTPGYNLGCLNYGDFTEFIGLPDESLSDTVARFLNGSAKDESKIYLISMYCGRSYRIYRFQGGSWQDTTGTMAQNAQGKWEITGDVLNPVTGFELLDYEGMCWWKGVSSVEAMMASTTAKSAWAQKLKPAADAEVPMWTRYFECMVDDKQLAKDYVEGKKVPYELYRMLRFCNDCDMMHPVEGHPDRVSYIAEEDKERNWSENLWKYASVESAMSYAAFSDFLAAGDQRAKNMQPMWFLEEGYSVSGGEYSADEAVRMYLNKIYDCDTVNGKDNNGGCTFDPEADPNRPTDDEYTNPYAGWGSILFNNLDRVGRIYLDGEHSNADGRSLTLGQVVRTMRAAETTIDGDSKAPFSPEGAKLFFIDKRLKKWQKVTSSYDGERKYIQSYPRANTLYFYALQGLGLTSLPQFIDTRWRIRDGYYQTGGFFAGAMGFRVAASEESAGITIKAAKTGYFGVGHENGSGIDETVFLYAGESHRFTRFSHTRGANVFIYQASRIAEIDLSEITTDSMLNLNVMTLVEKIVLGGQSHIDGDTGYSPLETLTLSSLPFLRELDVRCTGIKSIDASGCPRLKTLRAEGGQLESITLAKSSPISQLTLPNTIGDLRLQYLPSLTYYGLPDDTLTAAGLQSLKTLVLESTPGVSVRAILYRIATDQPNGEALTTLRIDGQQLRGDASELLAIANWGKQIYGIEGGATTSKPVINGDYTLTTVRESSEIERIESTFQGLRVLVEIAAYIGVINSVNGESYGGAPEVEEVNLDNVIEHIRYYNGETYADYLARYERDNMSIHDLIRI